MAYNVHFVGPLANVNESIYNLSDILEHNFKILEINVNEFDQFHYEVKNVFERDLGRKLSRNCCMAKNLTVYYIHNSFELENFDEKKPYPNREVENFRQTLYFGYLHQLIELLRLFKEGNICIPFTFYYWEKDGIFSQVSSNEWMYPTLPGNFNLKSSEIPELKSFLKRTEIPFKNNSIELAFKNYTLSFQVHNHLLQFLSIINGLESLLHPANQGELRYRISRNLAVLIGDNLEEAEKINSKMKKLYDKRSDIVHRGHTDLEKEDVLLARHYLREAIKKFNQLSKPKDEILKILTSKGFEDQI